MLGSNGSLPAYNLSINSSESPSSPDNVLAGRMGIPHSGTLVGGVTIFSVIGNSVILYSICNSKEFRRPTNYTVANLAVISIYRVLIFISVALMKLGWIEFTSQWTCKLYGLSQRACHPLEGFALAWLSIERSQIVRNPWKRFTLEDARKRIISVWVVAFGIQIPSVFFWNISKIDTLDSGYNNMLQYTCSNTKLIWRTHHAWLVALGIDLVFVILSPMLVLLKELLLLIVSLKFLRVFCAPSTSNDGDEETSRKKLTEDHVRVIRNAIAFTVLYITVNLPLGLWYTFYQTPAEYLPNYLKEFVMWSKSFFYLLAILHCGFFPLLVFALSKNLRAHCKKNLWPPGCIHRNIV